MALENELTKSRKQSKNLQHSLKIQAKVGSFSVPKQDFAVLQRNMRAQCLLELIPNLHLAQALWVQVQTSVTARAKRRFLQPSLRETYVPARSTCEIVSNSN